MNATDFEKLGIFYLGRPVDPDTGERIDAPFLLDAEDLTTHALCLGMTGSGKTGLGIGLLEEAAIDGIPAIVVDPKGDLGNLLLQFPELRAADFRPWIDVDQARREGTTPDALAESTAATWASGLAKWGQDGDRIRRLANAADFAIYTPGSPAGLQLSIFSALDAPPPAVRLDPNSLRDSVTAAVSSLLALANLSTDPQSPAFILLSTLVDREWRAGRSLRLDSLIRLVQAPPMDRIGVFPLDTVIAPKERLALGKKLNALLASPSLEAWNQGEPLDIQRLLYTADGRPRISVISIAHLSESERMFFTTLLLTAVVAWMRQQPGTSSLRALFYMDEIFGYFPPTSNPPSKAPMLTLLKQARAFGLGIVLATQNPVDLDYRGLSNIGLWLIGRLQTERDKKRLIDGLVGASAVDGLDPEAIGKRLAALRKREFLVRNVHSSQLQLMESRWCLSYLRGPLALPEIATLMGPRKAAQLAADAIPAAAAPVAASGAVPATFVAAETDDAPLPPPVILPPEIEQRYFPVPEGDFAADCPHYVPHILVQSRLHYADARKGIDCWRSTLHLLPVTPTGEPDWSQLAPVDDDGAPGPAPRATYDTLPPALADAKTYPRIARDFKAHRALWTSLQTSSVPTLKLYADPDESDGDFRVRIDHALREAVTDAKEKLNKKYGPKIAALDEKIRKAAAKIDTEKAQLSTAKLNVFLRFGAAIASVFLGRSASGMSRAASGIGSLSRSSKDKLDVQQAEATLQALNKQKADLEAEIAAELQAVETAFAPDAHPVVPCTLEPKSTDIIIQRVLLAWLP